MSLFASITKLDFQPISLECRGDLLPYLQSGEPYGSEASFANLYLWEQQYFAVLDGYLLLRSRFGDRTLYHYPIGTGDVRPVIEAILADAAETGVDCILVGLRESDARELETQLPNRFAIVEDRDSFDYVYGIDDLADLAGKKYHAKRNHVSRFEREYPNAALHPLSAQTLPAVRRMLDDWYRTYEEQQGFFESTKWEKNALQKALLDFEALQMEGLVLTCEDRAVALTLGSRISPDCVDVHFEKADLTVSGAYPAINRAFARHIREKYPDVRFLNREEDMGLLGLRKAKESYYPHRMFKKYRAMPRKDTL